MKKTIPITLAGTLFHIEEDAYVKLKEYLDAVKAYFSVYPEKDEIVADIEARISEHFRENSDIAKSKDKIVTEKDVLNIIQSMGSVKDFSDEESFEKTDIHNTENPWKKRKLFRDPDNMILGGVASGIAAYFNMDPVIIRLIFVLVVLAGGSGIFIYIILWLVMPIAKNSADKLHMTGRAVTLESVKEVVKERVDEVKKNKGILRKIITFPFSVIRRLIEFFAPLLRIIIGLIVTIGSSIALFGLTSFLAITAFNIESPYIDFPLMEIGHNTAVFFGIAAVFISICIPLLFVLFLGLSILQKRKAVSGKALLILLIMWCGAVITTGVIGSKLVPVYKNFIETSPLYIETTKAFTIEEFSEINAENTSNITIKEASETAVTATGPLRSLEDLNIYVENGVLHVKRSDRFIVCIFCDSPNSNIEIQTPTLKKVTAKNDVTVNLSATTTDLVLDFSNDSRLNFTGSSDTLSLTLSNGARATLVGSGKTATFITSNASRLRAQNFLVSDATVAAENASRADVTASKTLKLTSQNASYILYYGNPIVTEFAENASRIRKATATTSIEASEWQYWDNF